MNYLELLNAFYEKIQCSRISNNGQLLYHTLLMINNKSSWSDWFSRTNVSISTLMGVSEKAFINARAELKQLGLIDFVSSKKRGECTKYRILYPTNYSTNDRTKGSSKEVQSAVQTPDINKLKQKTKTEKSITNVIPEKSAPKLELEDLGEELKAALESYIAHREAMGRPLTTAALDMLLKRLEELAPENDADKVAVLEQSIRNGWKDIYALDKSLPASSASTSKNRFHNFDQAETDYDALMMKKLQARMAEDVPG